MAALPKKKRTKTRKGKRWSHSELSPVSIPTCPHCRASKRSHQVCPNCGYYAGREVIKVGEKESMAGE